MTIALRQTGGVPVAPAMAAGGGTLARIEVFDRLETAEPYWRALEADRALLTPYQRYDFLAKWQCYVGQAEGVVPLIVTGFDAADRPVMLLPFGRRPMHGLSAAEFLGGKHCNFNTGLWRQDIAGSITAAELRDTLSGLAQHADALLLSNQPLDWHGTTNPLARLPHRASPSMGCSGSLQADFNALLRSRTSATTRKKMRKKEHALASHGPVGFERVTNPDRRRQVLKTFFQQKTARMRALGLADVFTGPETRQFIAAAVTEPGHDGRPVIELHALSVAGITVATMGGTVWNGRYCCMFNSIIPDRFEAESPGEQLLTHLVRWCCQRGLTTFDLGTGEAAYKKIFCPDTERLFETLLPLTARGHGLVALATAKSAIKRAIKQSPVLWSALGRIRRWRAAALHPAH